MTVFDAISIRRSIRSYSPREIPEEILRKMLLTLRYAPSACNLQPWRFIVVRDPEIRRRVAEASNGQMFIAEAPVIIVGCAFPEEAYRRMGGYGNSAEIDVTIAVDHLTLAAIEEGLGTCWIGAFREERVKELLGIPRGVKVVALTPLGYPSDSQKLASPDPKKERRKSLEEIVSYDSFGR